MMKNYIKQIQSLSNPTFQDILQIARKNCGNPNCPNINSCKPWARLNHGTELLDNHKKLCKYLCAYGEMHEAKIKKALSLIQNPQIVFNNDLAIIDWGCGQALASICFFDFIKKKNISSNVQEVILIEPSDAALKRAKQHINAYVKDESKIKTIRKYLDEIVKAEIKTTQPVTLHFFSNILDIPQIDLKKLAKNVGENIVGEHYFFCISPFIPSRSHRIDIFYNYFNEPIIISSKEQSDNKLQLIAGEELSKNSQRNYTLKLKIFKFEKNKDYYIPIEYYPSVQFHAGYQLDCVKYALKKLPCEKQKQLSSFYKRISNFEVSAPFDIGACVYDGVHPILAVLNNIVTRGLPTKASPFIETSFEKLGNKKADNDFGIIEFKNKNTSINDSQINHSPIAIARIQKTILEALITGKLDINQKKWSVLVIERDVPCAVIAFEDLKQMFTNLVALSKDYSEIQFPNIELEVISPQEYSQSPLHLNIKPYVQATAQHKCKKYDMVIDISMSKKDDPEKISFSEFQSNNNCYFKIRSAKEQRNTRYIYTSDTIEYLPLVEKDSQGNYKNIEERKARLAYFLQLLFRKEDFRVGQLPILSRALQNKSVIGLLPTGGGKSLTYQLAAMLQPGVAIVIDPLRSLMKDQYDGLINIGIDTCTYINSTLDSIEKNKRERQMESSQIQFIFLSPERLSIYRFRELLKTMREMGVYFSYGVIDEVHCVSEWGHDFRFSYLHLGRNLYNFVCPKNQEKHITLFGLTATASFDVLADVERELSGNGAFPLDSDTVVRYENTNRLELQFKIEKVPVEFEVDKFFDKFGKLDATLPKAVNISDKWTVYNTKKEFLKKYIYQLPSFVNDLQTIESVIEIKKKFNERQNSQDNIIELDLNTNIENDFYKINNEYAQAGIVFCPHRDSTGISVDENANSLMGIIPQISTFIGSGDSDNADEIDKISFKNLERFRDNKSPLMVATKAFGMGIDKPNVRFTVNMNYSSSLESFVQEAGRAGRDKKMALATILFTDYKLVRINRRCPLTTFPIVIIKNKWFKEEDLLKILIYYNLSVDSQYLDYYTPQHDLVRLCCEKSKDKHYNRIFTFGECELKCEKFNNCALKNIPQKAKSFQYYTELKEILLDWDIEISNQNLEYINADYDTVMYFYNKNFKGSSFEKQKMHEILSQSETKFFYGNNEEIKTNGIETVNNFLRKLLSVEVGTELVAFVFYGGYYSDYAKAIYRMCCIDLIDDFTQDYINNRFRIVTKRKNDGEYYQGLKRFLLRYYSEDKAEEEIQKVPNYKGLNEIHKSLGYLTEFIYEKIAVKRKRAIDDMRLFCIQGLNNSKDWKETNEDLKDFIYYYFNSKYAKDDYKTEKGEPFSLTIDTEKGKLSSFDILFKYLRVVKEEVYGFSGSPKDSVKHLQGAVRLIRRSLTDKNASLSILNAFCLSYIETNNNETLERELESSYKEGYTSFYNNSDKNYFYHNIDKLNEVLTDINISKKILNKMQDWAMQCELDIHKEWLKNFQKTYTK